MQFRNGPAAVTERFESFPFRKPLSILGRGPIDEKAGRARCSEVRRPTSTHNCDVDCSGQSHALRPVFTRFAKSPSPRRSFLALRTKRRNERTREPIAQPAMSTASHHRYSSALLGGAEAPLSSPRLFAGVNEIECAAKVEKPGSPVLPVILIVESRPIARSSWRSRVFGAGSASIALHTGVLLAAWQVLAPSVVPWRLHLERGRNSVSLQASIAASPSSVLETEVRVLPEPPTTIPRATLAPRIPVTLDTKATTRVLRSNKPEATLSETEMAQATPPEILRRQTAPTPSDADSEEAEIRPPTARRKSTAKLPLQTVVVEVSSAASPGAAASSGADVPVPPRDVYRVLPKYPPESYAAGEEGTVVLWVRVDDQGNVRAAGVKNSCGYPRLDAAAVTAIHKWRFAPATPGDQSRASIFKSSLTFTIPKTK